MTEGVKASPVAWRKEWRSASQIGAAHSKELRQFADGYDLEAERETLRLAGVLEGDGPPPDDPYFVRWSEFESRSLAVANSQPGLPERPVTVEKPVQSGQTKVQSIGRLVTDGQDQIELHTREAAALFLGRMASHVQGERLSQIIGGRRVAADLKILTLLSVADNPYADCALLEFERVADDILKHLQSQIEWCDQCLKSTEQYGMKLAVQQSSRPGYYPLDFASPYAYKMIFLLATFDRLIRYSLTLRNRGLQPWDQDASLRLSFRKKIRALFDQVHTWSLLLNRIEATRALSRKDWLPGADAAAQQRVALVSAAVAKLKHIEKVPAPVMLYATLPSAHQRRSVLSQVELDQLASVMQSSATVIPLELMQVAPATPVAVQQLQSELVSLEQVTIAADLDPLNEAELVE
ncbi:PFL_4669 family integrating conjugative element protein [Parachitinimonas caeni]|uniref:TIGR03761 family integrating conjugative element protein n=1 Tax=Parachitinimonas caeni TaxID=3031301 RepID=A0ABT7E2E0_9NEIS|nr:TIGR03761 family integrating conjugative element protein [Parachitinimonas caeni]MDK2126480.1 TIGR03761 family integrating conjugative element protein [Parachitinimonas caeni]